MAAARLPPQLLARAVVVGASVALEVELVGPEGARARPSRRCASLLDQRQVVAGDVACSAPAAWSTSTTSAPRARIIAARSSELPRDITATKGCPVTAHTMASPVPVLPLVSSTTVWPGCSRPSTRGVLDHPQGDAVLLRPARVEVVELGQDPARARMEPTQLDQRRGADRIEHGTENGRHRPSMGAGAYARRHVRSRPDRSRRACRRAAEVPRRDHRRGRGRVRRAHRRVAPVGARRIGVLRRRRRRLHLRRQGGPAR